MVLTLKRFKLGEDFTEEEYLKWKKQLEWWVAETMPRVEDPVQQVENILLAAMNGTKMDGSIWNGISQDFYKRVKQLCGFDLELGIGKKQTQRERKVIPTSRTAPKTTEDELPPLDIGEAMKLKDEYKQDLLAKYPHLENPVYQPKVDELSEIIVKGRMMANEFIMAGSRRLDSINKTRESLNKQVADLMNFLEISPKLLVAKKNEAEKTDVGSLIAEMESYGTIWQDYERIDSLRELLQKYKQLKSLRPDGTTPQLDDWELWHQTRNRPVDFTCECGRKYTLLGGFTPEEIEAALVQAYEIYGFGLEGIEGKEHEDIGEINSEILPQEIMVEPPTLIEEVKGIDEDIGTSEES
jgi:hypothetical protein